jgi:hypothetical protein
VESFVHPCCRNHRACSVHSGPLDLRYFSASFTSEAPELSWDNQMGRNAARISLRQSQAQALARDSLFDGFTYVSVSRLHQIRHESGNGRATTDR